MFFQVEHNSPAWKVGLKAKDLLITVNNTYILEMGHDEVVKIIKTAHLDLELTIERCFFFIVFVSPKFVLI